MSLLARNLNYPQTTEKMNVNYVVANYLGERRFAPSLAEDPLFYVKAHCKFFQDNNVENVSKVTFVLNKSDEKIDEQFVNFLKNEKLNVEHEVIVRDNVGFSYGAWQDMVERNPDFDYHFLIEDDYVPTTGKIINRFLEGFKNDTIYVCCIYERGHCAMSSGLLNTKMVINEKKKNTEMILNATKSLSKDYCDGIHNQKIFLKNFEELGYNICDLSEKYRWLFVNHLGNISQHGNLEGEILLKPLFANKGSEILKHI